MGQCRKVNMITIGIHLGISAFGLPLLFTVVAAGQNVSERFCKGIEESVIKPLNPTQMINQIVFNNDCWFEFTVTEDVDVLLDVEVHDTEEESHESLERSLFMYGKHDGLDSEKALPLNKLDTNNNWDEVYFSKAGKIGSGFILLRKGKVAIKMLSPKDELLIRMEKLVRDGVGRKAFL